MVSLGGYDVCLNADQVHAVIFQCNCKRNYTDVFVVTIFPVFKCMQGLWLFGDDIESSTK